jgi:hypothetical protein
MKLIQVLTVLLVLVCGISSVLASEVRLSSLIQNVEVPLNSLFAPYHGYDDTNNIEIVLYGNLPNPCYGLGKYTLDKDLAKHTIRVRQFAEKKLEGVCADGSDMPDSLNMVVPFVNVISLGRLPAGDYQVYYGINQFAQKPLNIKESHKTTIDDYPYAAVSNVSTSDVIQKNTKLLATLSGVYTSSCVYLDKSSVKVEKQNDVYVVLPVLKMKPGVICTQSLIPFNHTIEMETPRVQGEYLVHVRSMNGKSVNRVVEVID